MPASTMQRAALDFAVCCDGAVDLFVGNYFSSFSYTVRESRAYEGAPSLYANGRNDGVELPWFRHHLEESGAAGEPAAVVRTALGRWEAAAHGPLRPSDG